MKRVLLTFGLFFLITLPSYSDQKTIILNNGEKIIGECKELKNGTYTISTSHGELQIKETEIRNISTGKEESENAQKVIVVESENKTDNLIQFLESKFYFLINVSKIDFNTERSKVLSEIFLKYGKEISELNNDQEIAAHRILPMLIYGCVFEILLQETLIVSEGTLSDYTGRPNFWGNFSKSLGTNDLVQYMITYTKKVFDALKIKEAFFKEFEQGKFISKYIKISCSKQNGKNGIILNIANSCQGYKKLYFFLIGAPVRAGSVAYCEKIADISEINKGKIFIENETVRKNGQAFFAVLLR